MHGLAMIEDGVMQAHPERLQHRALQLDFPQPFHGGHVSQPMYMSVRVHVLVCYGVLDDIIHLLKAPVLDTHGY